MANYVITGKDRNGRRFRPIYTTQPWFWNIWQGTVWKIDDKGKRKKIKDIVN